MREEIGRRRIDERAPRHFAAAGGTNPARFHQHVERAFRDLDAADRLDLRAAHRFVIGDDRQRLDAGATQLARLLALAPQDMGKVRRGLEMPAIPPLDQFDPAPRIILTQRLERAADILVADMGAQIGDRHFCIRQSFLDQPLDLRRVHRHRRFLPSAILP